MMETGIHSRRAMDHLDMEDPEVKMGGQFAAPVGRQVLEAYFRSR